VTAPDACPKRPSNYRVPSPWGRTRRLELVPGCRPLSKWLVLVVAGALVQLQLPKAR